ncbi:MAG: hypothetical protein KAV87_37450 [Desulfobacteraceae bacterium]|jgi:hypothetical protein|nr:hypothetical protein [Desulfobacteraceae bacterium]
MDELFEKFERFVSGYARWAVFTMNPLSKGLSSANSCDGTKSNLHIILDTILYEILLERLRLRGYNKWLA